MLNLKELQLPARQKKVDEALRPFLQGHGAIWREKPQLATKTLGAFRRRPGFVLQILEAILAARLEGNVQHFNVAIESFAQKGAWEGASSLLDKMGAIQILPNVVSCASTIKACGKGGQWVMALDILQQSLNSRISPDLRLVNGLISSLDGQWRIAVNLFGSMPELSLAPDVFACNTVLKALGKGKKWETACRFFHTMDKMRVSPSIVTANTAIAILSSQKKWWLTLDILEDLPSKELVPDRISYQSVLKAVGVSFQWEQAIRVLSDMTDAEALEFSLTMTACGKAHHWTQALELLSLLRQRLVQEDVLLRNAAICACGQAKKWQHALALFGELGLQVDQVAIRTAIAACASQWQHVLSLLNSLPQLMLSGTLLTHTAAVRACGEGSQWQWAVQLLSDVQRQAITADVILYTTTINACSASGEETMSQPSGLGQELSQPWPAALFLFANLKGLSLSPDRIAYTAAISACGKAGKWQHSLELLRESQLAHVQSDSTTYVTTISACKEHWQYAVYLLTECHLSQITSDIVACNAAISCCAEGLQWQHAMLLQSFPQEVCLQKDIVTCNAAISACEKSCQWKVAVDLLGQIHEEQLQMTVISYNLLISSCAKGEEWQRGLELLMDLELAGVQSNLITQSVAINACGRGLQWQASLQILADSETVPNVVVFGTLLNALQNGSLWEQALVTLSMMDAELEPSVACYDYALLACQAGGRHDLAFELLLRSRSTRSAVSFLWGLSMINNIEASRIHAACVDVLRASDSLVLTQRDVATAWWSTSILGASNARLRKNLADQAVPILFFFEGVLNVV